MLIICIAAVECFIIFDSMNHFKSIYKIAIKVTKVLSSSKISDHWKELVIPSYALALMKKSLQILFILFLVICILLVPELFVEGFVNYILSFSGVLESFAFALIYIKIKKAIFSE